MPDPVSAAELAAQAVELLPARTVLSTLATPSDGGTDKGPGLGQGVAGATMYWLGFNMHSQGADGTSADGQGGVID